MHLGAMKGLPKSPASGVRTCTTIRRRRCLSAALSALDVFLRPTQGSRTHPRLWSCQRSAPQIVVSPPTANGQSPITSHLSRPRWPTI